MQSFFVCFKKNSAFVNEILKTKSLTQYNKIY